MILKNITLATLFTTILIAGGVESTGKGRKRESTCNLAKLMSRLLALLAPPLPPPHEMPIEKPQQVENHLVSPSGREEIGVEEMEQTLHEPSSGEETSSLPIEVEDPIASSPEGQGFIGALQRNDMEAAALHVFNSDNDELKRYCPKRLISLGDSNLVELIHGTDLDNKTWMLQVILVHADQQLVNKVFGKVNPPNKLLREVAYSANLACIPQRFIYLFGRIDDKRIKKRLLKLVFVHCLTMTKLNASILWSSHLLSGH
jgi:hypothetical protein